MTVPKQIYGHSIQKRFLLYAFIAALMLFSFLLLVFDSPCYAQAPSLTWQASPDSDTVTHYRIYWRKADTIDWEHELEVASADVCRGATCGYRLGDLSPQLVTTRYYFALKAKNSRGTSPFSASIAYYNIAATTTSSSCPAR